MDRKKKEQLEKRQEVCAPVLMRCGKSVANQFRVRSTSRSMTLEQSESYRFKRASPLIVKQWAS